ncbi:MAG: hypothetical protein ACRD1D_17125, partial [Acidimicrobiales bacterium]
CAVVRDWNGTMAWRARTRLALLTASFALATGEVESAAAQARAVAIEAAAADNPRHALRARLVEAQARALAGQPVDAGEVDAALTALDRCAGLESWRITAEAAAACGVERWAVDAERRAATLLAQAGPYTDRARRWVEQTLEGIRGSTRR